jgi:hypothetical protein
VEELVIAASPQTGKQKSYLNDIWWRVALLNAYIHAYIYIYIPVFRRGYGFAWPPENWKPLQQGHPARTSTAVDMEGERGKAQAARRRVKKVIHHTLIMTALWMAVTDAPRFTHHHPHSSPDDILGLPRTSRAALSLANKAKTGGWGAVVMID